MTERKKFKSWKGAKENEKNPSGRLMPNIESSVVRLNVALIGCGMANIMNNVDVLLLYYDNRILWRVAG